MDRDPSPTVVEVKAETLASDDYFVTGCLWPDRTWCWSRFETTSQWFGCYRPVGPHKPVVSLGFNGIAVGHVIAAEAGIRPVFRVMEEGKALGLPDAAKSGSA